MTGYLSLSLRFPLFPVFCILLLSGSRLLTVFTISFLTLSLRSHPATPHTRHLSLACRSAAWKISPRTQDCRK